MIRDYFSEVEKKLEEIKWLIKKNFPFHLHTPEGVRECDKVNLIEVVDIVKALISKGGAERK